MNIYHAIIQDAVIPAESFPFHRLHVSNLIILMNVAHSRGAITSDMNGWCNEHQVWKIDEMHLIKKESLQITNLFD